MVETIGRIALFAMFVLGVVSSGARAEPAVDVALVLAVDVSLSIDAEEFALQRAGYAAAFRNQRVVEAITGGATGAVAVIYRQWSGAREQQQIIGWQLINGRASAARFSAALA